jgi:hypothetical protein
MASTTLRFRGLHRGCAWVRHLLPHRDALGAAVLAKALGTPRAQVYRIRDRSIVQVDAIPADRPIGVHDTYVYHSGLYEAHATQCGPR